MGPDRAMSAGARGSESRQAREGEPGGLPIPPDAADIKVYDVEGFPPVQRDSLYWSQ